MATDAAVQAAPTEESAGPAGGSALPVVDFTGVLADLSTRTPRAEATLAAALDAMMRVRATQFRTLAEPADRAERLAVDLARADLQMRARLVQADVLMRQGDIAEAGRLGRQINAWAVEHEDEFVLARSHHLLALFFYNVGDLADALAHVVQAVAHSGDGVPTWFRARHLSTLALILQDSGSWDEAQRRYQEALDAGTAADDGDLLVAVLNNMAYGAYQHGDREQALGLVERMRAVELRRGPLLGASDLDTIARVEMMHGRYAEAEATLRPVLDGSAVHLLTEADGLPECLLTTAEAQRLRGDVIGAQASLDRAAKLCEERGLASVRARVRQEQAQLYAATGRFREAYEEYRVFHAETQALQSAQREARARTLQAVFETEEARRESLRFRELAQRDALTGLHNRRYVDEHLPELLERGTSVSVALVDLDHFKRVNDTLSHAVGDLVLQEFATLLLAAAAGDGVAARLGGEEFLLVLSGHDADEAVRRCEELRHAVADHDWAPVTRDLPITASIGVTTVFSGQATVSALLAQADRNLYAAKRAGRNRVVADPA